MSRSKPQKRQIPVAKSPEKKLVRTYKPIFDWKPLLVLTVFAFILYANTLNNDFALDDAIVITDNQFTQKGTEGISDIFKYDTFTGFWMTSYPGKTAEQIQQEKKLVAGGRYRPLSLATFAVETEFFGKNINRAKGQVPFKGNPFISHLVNILLYLFTTILLFIILKKLFPPDNDRKWYFSFPMIVSLLFLAHPIHTEAVANIKGRDEIMTLLGSLGALWFTIKYFDSKKFYNLILSSVCLFLGLLSKENAITFLAIIPLTIYYFTNNSLKKIFISIIPLFVVAGIFLLIRTAVLQPGEDKETAARESVKPDNILVQNVKYPDAEIVWTDKNAESWNIKVSTKPIDPAVAKGDIIDGTASEKPYDLSGLEKEKGYYVYIQSIYKGGKVSEWGDGFFYPEIMNNPFIYANSQEKYATIFYTLWVYIKLLFFPHPLTYDYYPYQIGIINMANPGAFIPLLLYLAMGLFAVWGMIKKKGIFSYSIWFYLLPLSVVSNIFFPVGTFMNERFVFISSIGFCILVGWLLYHYVPKLIKNPQTAVYVTGATMFIVLGLYSFKTIDRNKAWKNDLVLFSTDVQVSVNSAKSNCSAGGKLIEDAQKAENAKDTAIHNDLCRKAIKYLERSIEIYPDYVDALNLMGNAHFEYNRNTAKSLEYYNKVLKSRPFHSVALGNARLVILNAYNLLNQNTSQSTPDEILTALQELIKTCELQQPTIDKLLKNNAQNPLLVLLQDAYHFEGTIYGRYKNQLDKAVLCYRKAEAIKINTAIFYRDFAVTQGFLNNLDESLKYFNKALEIDKADVQTYINAAVTNLKLGDSKRDVKYYQDAVELLEQSIKISPENHMAYYYLGILNQRSGNVAKSREYYSKAISILENILAQNPQDENAQRMIQEIVTQAGR